MWYVVQTKPRDEIRAKEHLEKQGFEVYLPLITRDKVIRSRIKRVVVPLFSRYLFLSKDSINQNFTLIQNTRGVCNLIKFGGVTAFVNNEVILTIKKGLDCYKEEQLVKNGESVKIIDGPLRGVMGIFLEKNPEGRARILVTMLSNSHELHIEHFQLIPCII